MPAQGFSNDQRLAGVLLVLAFVSFAIGAGLPTVGPRGNFNIFTLPLREHLATVTRIAVAWRWANIFMGTASVILTAGLSLLTTVLEESGEKALSRLGLMGWLLAAGLWLSFSAFRAVVTLRAGHEMLAQDAVPPYYEPLASWSAGMFFAYAAIGFLAVAAYGGSFLRTALLPGWVAWATVVFSLAMLIVLIAKGDNLPIFHYLPPLLIGILLLFRR